MVFRTLEQNGCTVVSWVPPNGFKDVSDLLAARGSIDDLVEMKFAEPLDDIVDHEEEEQQTDAIIEATTPLSALAERISDLLQREDISENVRLTKASMLIGSFGHEDEIDRGRLVNWSDFLLENENDEYDWVCLLYTTDAAEDLTRFICVDGLSLDKNIKV